MHKTRTTFFRLQIRVWAAALALALSPGSVHAERKAAATVPAPPLPMEASVKVRRGETVEIPLKIYGTRSQSLEFRIRTTPQGNLSSVRQVEQEVAAVTYTPPTNTSITRDRFSYSVKSSQGVSAAVEVQIAILDEPPRLVTPAELLFAPLLLGQVASQPIQIVNRGGGIAEGDLEVDAPWQIEDSPHYRLEAGQSQTFTVRLVAGQAGLFQADLRFSSQPDRATVLRGKAIAPIAFEAPKLILSPRGQEAERSGEFTVTNNSSQPAEIHFKASDRLLFARQLHLAARASETVLVSTDPSDVAPISTEVQLESGNQPGLKVEADAAPSRIIAAQSALVFALKPGQSASQTLVLTNLGGVASAVTLEITPPFRLDLSSLTLKPGQSQPITVSVLPSLPGKLEADLQIHAGSQKLTIAVSGTVRAASAPSTHPSESFVPQDAREPGPQEPTDSDQEPPPSFATISELTPTSVVIRLPEHHPTFASYRAEKRELSLENGELAINWSALPAFTTVLNQGRVDGSLTGLVPGTYYCIRISGLRTGGQSTNFTQQVVFTSPATSRKGEHSWSRNGVLGGLLLVALSGLWWEKRRRGARL